MLEYSLLKMIFKHIQMGVLEKHFVLEKHTVAVGQHLNAKEILQHAKEILRFFFHMFSYMVINIDEVLKAFRCAMALFYKIDTRSLVGMEIVDLLVNGSVPGICTGIWKVWRLTKNLKKKQTRFTPTKACERFFMDYFLFCSLFCSGFC